MGPTENKCRWGHIMQGLRDWHFVLKTYVKLRYFKYATRAGLCVCGRRESKGYFGILKK